MRALGIWKLIYLGQRVPLGQLERQVLQAQRVLMVRMVPMVRLQLSR